MRGSPLVRLKAWLRVAYGEPGSKEHQVHLSGIIWLVIFSVVLTVLQQDVALDTEHEALFRAADAITLVAFSLDYALNIIYAPRKRAYIFSFAGAVDLLAILPSLLIFVDTTSVKFLRSLRFLRFLRVLQLVKALRHYRLTDEGSHSEPNLLLDLQIGVVVISALLLLIPDDALRNTLLLFVLGGAVTTGVRRWLVYRQLPAASIAVLLASVLAASVYAFQLDAAGQPDWATWLLVATVFAAALSWLRTEAPAGI